MFEKVLHTAEQICCSLWRSYYQEPNWIMNGDQNGEKKFILVGKDSEKYMD